MAWDLMYTFVDDLVTIIEGGLKDLLDACLLGHPFLLAAALCQGRGRTYSSTGENMSLPTPHRGQTQSSGMSAKAVPGATPESGSPWAGS